MARLVDEPRYMPTIMADKTCGLVTVNAILAALYEREQSGEGQFVEIPCWKPWSRLTWLIILAMHSSHRKVLCGIPAS